MNLDRYKAPVWVVAMVITAIGLSCAATQRDSDNQVPTTRRIEDAHSSDPIFLDVVADHRGTFHLVWLSAERGLYYQRSKNQGETWSAPNMLADPLPPPVTIGPRIISSQDRLGVLWLSRGINVLSSSDGGDSWNTPGLQLDLGVPVRDYDIDERGDSIALVFFGGSQMHYIYSGDLGLSWSTPKGISAEYRKGASASAPSVAMLGNSVHVIWSLFDEYGDEYGGGPRPTLRYLRSTDLGLNWDDAKTIQVLGGDDGNHLTYPILHADIKASDGLLHIAYQANLVEHQSSDDLGATWARQQPLTQASVRALKLAGDGSGNTHIVWIDERYQKREWWGHIPGHQAVLWNADPTWADNDLFHAVVSPHATSHETRLTVPLSYVEQRRGAFVALPAADSVFVFWSGKARVGRSLMESNSSNELFYCAAAFKQEQSE